MSATVETRPAAKADAPLAGGSSTVMESGRVEAGMVRPRSGDTQMSPARGLAGVRLRGCLLRARARRDTRVPLSGPPTWTDSPDAYPDREAA